MTEIKVLDNKKVAKTFIVRGEECRLLTRQVFVQHAFWFELHSKQDSNLRMYFNSKLLSMKAKNIPLYHPSKRVPHFYAGDKSLTASLSPARHKHVRRKGILEDPQVNVSSCSLSNELD